MNTPRKWRTAVIGSIRVSWPAPKKVREITVVGHRRMATWDELATLRPVMIFDKGVAKKPRVGGQVVRVLAVINESIAKGGAPVAGNGRNPVCKACGERHAKTRDGVRRAVVSPKRNAKAGLAAPKGKAGKART